MKMSYKIALIVSVVICLLAFFVIQDNSPPEPTQASAPPVDQAHAQEERKSLRADSKGDGSLKSMVNAKTPAPTNGAAGSLALDARSRVLASLDKDSPKADPQKPESVASNTAKDTPSPSPLGSSASGAIALARTETEKFKPDPAPQPTTTVSLKDLDAVLGSVDRSATATPVKTLTIGAPRDDAVQTATTKTENQKPETYIVQPGDTFSSIATKLYNDERRWVDLSQANFVDPTKLKVGQVLRLPDDRQVLAQEEPVPAGPGGVQSYTIRPGDSLSTVAQNYYGDPTLWRTIYNFNRDKIGDNPNAIQAGMTLKVPPTIKGAR